MIYDCTSCNFNTDLHANYIRHMNTQKHMIKIKEKIFEKHQCTSCGKKFGHSSGLSRHKKDSCPVEIIAIPGDAIENMYKENEHLKKQLLQREIDHLKNQLSQKDNELDKCNTIIKDTTEIAKNSTVIAKTSIEAVKNSTDAHKYSMSTLSYLAQNFIKIEPITKFTKMHLLNGNNTLPLAESMIICHRSKNYSLSKYIGDIVVKEYTKEDPKDQAVWSSDPSRRTYILCERVESSGMVVWHIDKEGKYAAKVMVDPILDHLKEAMINYINDNVQTSDDDDDNVQTSDGEEILEDKKKIKNKKDYAIMCKNIATASEIEHQIKSGVLRKKILEYMAPHFFFDKKKFMNIGRNNVKKMEIKGKLNFI